MNPESNIISLRVGEYDDIFSDFDIRPHTTRALSTDFLDEIQRATVDKTYDGVELVIHIHDSKHNSALEGTIRDRLMKHFGKHVKRLDAERRRMMVMGMIMIFTGALCMTAVTALVYYSETKTLLIMLAFAFLDPAGWFLLWEGMDQIIFRSNENKPKHDFYKKMSHHRSDIHFNVFR